MTNFWVRKTRVGSKMFYDAKFAEPWRSIFSIFYAIIGKMGLVVTLTGLFCIITSHALCILMLWVSCDHLMDAYAVSSMFLAPYWAWFQKNCCISLKNLFFAYFLIMIDGICSNLSRYTVWGSDMGLRGPRGVGMSTIDLRGRLGWATDWGLHNMILSI